VKLVKVAEHYLPWFKTPTQVPLYRDWATPLYDRRGTTYHGMAALFLHPMRQHTGQVVTMPASKEETPLGYMATSTGWDMLPFYADHEPTTGPAYDQLSVYDWIHALKYELEPGDALAIEDHRVTYPQQWDSREARTEVVRLICAAEARARDREDPLLAELLATIFCQEFGFSMMACSPSHELRTALQALTAEALAENAIAALEMAHAITTATFGDEAADRFLPMPPNDPGKEAKDDCMDLFED